MIGKILTNCWKFVKFFNIFPRQNFAPYNTLSLSHDSDYEKQPVYYTINIDTHIHHIELYKDFHLKVFILVLKLDWVSGSDGSLFLWVMWVTGSAQNLDCFVLVILSVTNNTGKINLGHHAGHQV